MKKALAYAATAILIGFAVMMLPLALKTGPPTYQPELTPQLPPQVSPEFFANTMERDDTKGVDSSSSRSYGFAWQTSILPSTLILLLGLIAALGVYALLKKRVI